MNNSEWLNQQITCYLEEERPAYVAYEQLLRTVLGAICSQVAPSAFCQVRVKAPESFAEKCLRKRDKYSNPVHQLTDLCGARIIVNSLDEIEPVCNLARQCFLINACDEEDTGERLDVSEFGYRSIHYLIRIDPARLPEIPGFDAATLVNCINGARGEIASVPRYAELQVRTLLQHAWSDITHDRVYKTSIHVPKIYSRECYRLAAVLESCDQRFNDVCRKISTWQQRYNAYMTPDQIQEECARLECIVENPQFNQNSKTQLVQRIARLQMATGNHAAVIAVCEPWKGDSEIRFLWADACCRLHRSEPESVVFQEGLKTLEALAAELPTDRQSPIIAERLSRLAWAKHQQRICDPLDYQELTRNAWNAAPENPYLVKEFIEASLLAERTCNFLPMLEHQMKRAIETCQEHIEVGIEVATAWMTIGQLSLLMDDLYPALEAYLKGLMQHPAPEQVEDEWNSLRRLIEALPEKSEEWIPALRLLALACYRINGGQPEDWGLIYDSMLLSERTCIVAGDCAMTPKTEYADWLKQALAGYDGLVISGGTDAGIPGLLGQIAQDDTISRKWMLVGYLPTNATDSKAYDRLCHTVESTAFSVLEPIRYWTDLLANGMKPSLVRLLGFGGGDISRFEYLLGIAMGATVGLMDNSGRATDELLNNAALKEHLLPLPPDPAALWCFFRATTPYSSLPQFHVSAQIAHEAYVETKRKQELKKMTALQPWEQLSEDFKRSNLHQAAFAAEILQSEGFDVKPIEEVDAEHRVLSLPETDVATMAEKEHGRWMIERLMQGWRASQTRDDAKRLHPDLIPWTKLAEPTREYDRTAIRAWPVVLQQAGLAILKQE